MHKIIIITLLLVFSLLAEGGRALSAKCMPCHGVNFEKSALGKSAIISRWDADTIYYALVHYQTKNRNIYGLGSLMAKEVNQYTYEELSKIASFISSTDKRVSLSAPENTQPSSFVNTSSILSNKERTTLNNYLAYLDTFPVIPHTPDVKQGQKVYLKLFKKIFGMMGRQFTSEHSTKEWDDLFANNARSFIRVYGEKFPTAIPILTDKENLGLLQYIGDFAKEYASDNGGRGCWG